MKPVTKSQKRVAELMVQLPLIYQEAKDYAETNFAFRAAAYKKTRYCLECGTQWKTDEFILTSQIIGLVCPNHDCRSKGAELALYDHNGDITTELYTSVVDCFKEYQLVRLLHTTKKTKKRKAAEFYHKEVVQYWIRTTDGKIEVASKNSASSYYADYRWQYGPIEIRKNNLFKNRFGTHSHLLPVDHQYPKEKIHPIVRRNGYLKGKSKLTPVRIFYGLLNYNFAETLFKLKQYALFDSFCISDFSEKYKNETMTCVKNNYKITDATLWKDTIDLMKYFNKDIKNPKYCCPENLRATHDSLMNKKRKRILEEEKEKLKSKMASEQKEYSKRIFKYRNISFSTGNIKIQVLKKVSDFYVQGEELKHCLFTNEYYKKKDSLILSAKINNNVIENIEVNLRNFTIEQSRGKFNQASKYNEEIVQCVKDNMDLIIQASKPKRKKNDNKKVA